jgi:uncharacterized protein (DUF111 family)
MKPDSLVVRTPCGLSGDMLLCGLARLLALDNAGLEQRVARIGIPALASTLRLQARLVRGITGWTVRVDLPHEHVHRGLAEIAEIIDRSTLAPLAKALASSTFVLLAEVEAEMHGIAVADVHFHEIGALDSILDVCVVAELFAELGCPKVTCSPLPVSDGVIRCDHGLLASPAPAVLQMLEGVPVYGVEGAGETVTPTALALLLKMQTCFGAWPAMTIERTVRIYGTREFTTVPNGAIFALGRLSSEVAQRPYTPQPNLDDVVPQRHDDHHHHDHAYSGSNQLPHAHD